jgi:putative redox protein
MAKVSASINKEHFKTEIVSGNNKITSDEPVSNGGKGEGLSPEELLCTSLAACTSITLRMYALLTSYVIELPVCYYYFSIQSY